MEQQAEPRAPSSRPGKWTAERVTFAVIVLAFVVTSIIYNVVTPAGEGVDEISHLQYTLYLKDHHALPVLGFQVKPDTVLMAYHAPLYYIVAAIVSTPLPTSGLNQALRSNPHFIWIEGVGPGNRNVFLHSPLTGEDSFPWQGIILTIHLLRLLSTLQGVATLFVIRALLRYVFDRPVLVLTAAAATAFQPTFLNTFSIAQNDGTVALFATLALLWCVRFVASKPRQITPARGGLGGIILGLGLLAKETGFALGPAYAVAFGIVAYRTRRWKDVVNAALGVGATTLAVAGWWYGRNWLLYGDPFAQRLFTVLFRADLRRGPYHLGDFLAFVSQLRRNYWAAFGYEHILADPRISNALWLVAILAIPGFLLTLTQRRGDRTFIGTWAVLLTAVLSLFTLFVQRSVVTGGGAAHGRYFVGVMPVVNAAVVLGLSRYSPRRWPVGPILYAGFLTLFGLAAPFLFIAPAYRPPLAQTEEIARATPESEVFGKQLRLVAASFDARSAAPGDEVHLTLYWTREKPLTSDLRYHLRIVSRDGTTFFAKDFWPGGGGVPTFTWPAGAVYRDDIRVPIPANVARGWARYLLSVQGANGEQLPAVGKDGIGNEVEIGRLAVTKIPIVSALPSETHHMNAKFRSPDGNDQLNLVAYQTSLVRDGSARLTLAVQLFWQATAPVRDDVTVSVQILDSSGRLVAQNDAEPDNGQAPTSTWPVGPTIPDARQVRLPATLSPGVYRVIVVAYTRPTLARLKVDGSGGQTDYLPLTEITLPAR